MLFTQDVEQKNILSVSELSFKIKKSIETSFSRISVKGEISGLKYHSMGHCYFSLKDDKAVIDAVCWNGTKLDFNLADGLEIVVYGRVTTYMGRSRYQIVVLSVKAAGEGALLKLLLERKQKLEKEGLFLHKKTLPSFPKRIGIVTSPTGAVISDILHRLKDRYPCHVIIWPALVQGQEASEQITKAIDGFNNLKGDQKPDILIVARGGGSLEDLWPFNEENVVRATARSVIPVVSAVGHETDTTLIDFASDLRAPTPTAAVELSVPVLKHVLEQLSQQFLRLFYLLRRFYEHKILHLQNLSRGLLSPKRLLEELIQRFDDWSDRFSMVFSGFLKKQEDQLIKANVLTFYNRAILEKNILSFDFVKEKFQKSCNVFVEKQTQNLSYLSLKLEQNSYQNILKRGFCMVSDNETLILSSKNLNVLKPKELRLHFWDDVIIVKIDNK
ncbi:MAG: exodeoxyribonuclease VII large subunit [Alphaproteobacteria bacterium]